MVDEVTCALELNSKVAVCLLVPSSDNILYHNPSRQAIGNLLRRLAILLALAYQEPIHLGIGSQPLHHTHRGLLGAFSGDVDHELTVFG